MVKDITEEDLLVYKSFSFFIENNFTVDRREVAEVIRDLVEEVIRLKEIIETEPAIIISVPPYLVRNEHERSLN